MGKFCPYCGQALDLPARFCSRCGAAQPEPVQTPPSQPTASQGMPPPGYPAMPQGMPPPVYPTASQGMPPPGYPAMPQGMPPPAYGEPLLFTVPVVAGQGQPPRLKGCGQILVFTPLRLLLANIRADLMSQAKERETAANKAAGKGLFGRMAAGMSFQSRYQDSYNAKTVAQILQEHPDSLQIPAQAVVGLRFRRSYSVSGGDGDSETYPATLRIQTPQGDIVLAMNRGDREQPLEQFLAATYGTLFQRLK